MKTQSTVKDEHLDRKNIESNKTVRVDETTLNYQTKIKENVQNAAIG